MRFTDEMLKRLKDEISRVPVKDVRSTIISANDAQALVERMEAAEKFAEIAIQLDCVNNELARSAIKAAKEWREKAGK